MGWLVDWWACPVLRTSSPKRSTRPRGLGRPGTGKTALGSGAVGQWEQLSLIGFSPGPGPGPRSPVFARLPLSVLCLCEPCQPATACSLACATRDRIGFPGSPQPLRRIDSVPYICQTLSIGLITYVINNWTLCVIMEREAAVPVQHRLDEDEIGK